jgi:tRNA A-37 threonylcarbamoyl transferase component Bud32
MRPKHLVSAIALLLGAVALAALGWRGSHEHRDPAVVARAAEVLKGRVEAALANELRPVEEAVSQGATMAPLRAALGNHVDSATLRDLLESEDWWLPFREKGFMARVIEGMRVTNANGFDVLEPIDALLAPAAAGKRSSGIFAGRDAPVLLAAARIVDREPAPILVLAARADTGILRNLANQSHLDLILAQGNQILGLASDPANEAALRDLVTNAQAQTALAEAGWDTVRVSVSPKLVLWAAQKGTAPAPQGPPTLLVGAGVLALLGAVFLFLGVAKKRAAPAAGAYADARGQKERTLPFGTPVSHQAVTHAGPLHRPVTGAPAFPGSTGGASVPFPGTDPGAHLVTNPGPLVGVTGDAPVPGPLLAPEDPSSPPKTFGRYKLLRPLGEGGMSEVYTAASEGAEGFTRTFVLKRLRPELAREKEAVSQFIDEARLQAGLVHTNIVPVFDFGKIGSEYFLTMEYIIGKNLYEVAVACAEKTGHCLDPRFVCYFIHEMLQALYYAHNKKDAKGRPLGIVHRDVSATNVMVTASGEVKLFDFGIAKADKRQTKTQAGTVKGNASFMSPEQARGQAVDGRADIFAAGLVMYFCLTNRLLYDGQNELDILYKAACGPQEADFEALRRLPEPAASIVKKALQPLPENRYQSATEFAAALAPHITGMKPAAAVLMEKLFGDELRRAEEEHAQETPLLATSQVSKATAI